MEWTTILGLVAGTQVGEEVVYVPLSGANERRQGRAVPCTRLKR